MLIILSNLNAESKILTFINTNGRQDMLTKKILNEKYNKKVFYLNEKKIFKKNISY